MNVDEKNTLCLFSLTIKYIFFSFERDAPVHDLPMTPIIDRKGNEITHQIVNCIFWVFVAPK